MYNEIHFGEPGPAPRLFQTDLTPSQRRFIERLLPNEYLLEPTGKSQKKDTLQPPQFFKKPSTAEIPVPTLTMKKAPSTKSEFSIRLEAPKPEPTNIISLEIPTQLKKAPSVDQPPPQMIPQPKPQPQSQTKIHLQLPPQLPTEQPKPQPQQPQPQIQPQIQIQLPSQFTPQPQPQVTVQAQPQVQARPEPQPQIQARPQPQAVKPQIEITPPLKLPVQLKSPEKPQVQLKSPEKPQPKPESKPEPKPEPKSTIITLPPPTQIQIQAQPQSKPQVQPERDRERERERERDKEKEKEREREKEKEKQAQPIVKPEQKPPVQAPEKPVIQAIAQPQAKPLVQEKEKEKPQPQVKPEPKPQVQPEKEKEKEKEKPAPQPIAKPESKPKPQVVEEKPKAAPSTQILLKKPQGEKKVTVNETPTFAMTTTKIIYKPPAEGLKKCYEVLQKLKKHMYATPFLQPVNEKALGITDYYAIIKHPMDLGTVEKKLKNEEYANQTMFGADVRQIWRNAMIYNAEGSPIYNVTLEMSAFFERLYKDIELNYPPPPPEKEPYDIDKKVRKLCKQMQGLHHKGGKFTAVDSQSSKYSSIRDVPMTPIERKALYINVHKLPSAYLRGVWDIVNDNVPPEKKNREVVDFDLETLPVDIMRKLERFVDYQIGIVSRSEQKSKKRESEMEVESAEKEGRDEDESSESSFASESEDGGDDF